MSHTTTYQISNGLETKTFLSESDVCKYLCVAKCTVASCWRRNSKCKGYTITRIGLSTHRETKTRLHKIWEGMLARCEYHRHPYYEIYGGRGIAVCNEWHNYVIFRDWAMSNGYSDTLTIDRIDNNLGYFPRNCRFITIKEQQNNKRNNHIVSYEEEPMTVAQMSELYGIPKSTIIWRERHRRDLVTGAKMEVESGTIL